MTEAGLLVAAIFLCLLGNGFFSGSEIAVISARRGRIEALVAEGSRAARRVRDLQDDIDRFLATAQIGVTLMGTLAGVLGGYLASRHVEPWLRTSVIARWLPPAFEAAFVVGACIVYVELIFGELVPKALALRFTEGTALLVSLPFQFMGRVSRGLIALLTASTRGVLMLFGMRDFKDRTFVSEEEIKHMVKEGKEQGVLDQAKVDLIHGVFAFSETPVKKVMVPRPKIFALDASTPPDDVARLIIESGFSRIPAYDGSIDSVLGLAYVKDILRLLEKRQPVVLRKILHPVHFVPETKKVGQLLKELQKRRTHLALVIDEHGSVTGLVTLEDLIEEIVGEIQDEYDWEERPVERLRDGSLVVEGTVSAADLRGTYAIPIPESEEFQTVAGFMLERLGSIPKGGEMVPLGEFRLTIVDVERNRISKVKVEKLPVAVKA
jgi:magnesium and cobalt exporter, CNNM family